MPIIVPLGLIALMLTFLEALVRYGSTSPVPGEVPWAALGMGFALIWVGTPLLLVARECYREGREVLTNLQESARSQPGWFSAAFLAVGLIPAIPIIAVLAGAFYDFYATLLILGLLITIIAAFWAEKAALKSPISRCYERYMKRYNKERDPAILEEMRIELRSGRYGC